MEILGIGILVGVIASVIVLPILGLVRVARSGRGLSDAERLDPRSEANLRPNGFAEVRMWEKHYGIAHSRAASLEDRQAEIVARRQRDGL